MANPEVVPGGIVSGLTVHAVGGGGGGGAGGDGDASVAGALGLADRLGDVLAVVSGGPPSRGATKAGAAAVTRAAIEATAVTPKKRRIPIRRPASRRARSRSTVEGGTSPKSGAESTVWAQASSCTVLTSPQRQARVRRLVIEQASERGQAVGGLAFDGARCATKRFRGLRHRTVAEIPQDEYGALPWRYACQRGLYSQSGRVVERRPGAVGYAREQRHQRGPARTPLAEERIDQHPPGVPVDVLASPHPAPVCVELGYGALDQVVGAVPVVHEQVCHLAQPQCPSTDIGDVLAFKLGLHAPLMHGLCGTVARSPEVVREAHPTHRFAALTIGYTRRV